MGGDGVIKDLPRRVFPRGVSSTRRLLAAVAVPVACVLVVGLLPATVLAKQARIFAGSFGAADSVPANPYPLAQPSGVAVDEASGDVYVGDPFNHRVEKFSPAGELLLMFGKEVNKSAVEEHRAAEEQNVCPAAGHPGDTCQVGTAGITPGAFEGAVSPAGSPVLFVAVDNSPGASNGDVYTGERSDKIVQKFDSSGRLLSSWGDKGQLDGSSVHSPPAPYPGPFSGPPGIAVDKKGDLWVGSEGTLFEFNEGSSFVTDVRMSKTSFVGIAVDPEGNLYAANLSEISFSDSTGNKEGDFSPEISPAGIATDVSGDLYIDGRGGQSGNEVVQLFGPSCHPLGSQESCVPAESFGSTHLSNNNQGLHGIAVDSSSAARTVYVADPEAARVVSFAIETIPDASTAKATSLTSASATLNGTVNPSGVALNEGVEGCRFEWGPTTAYGHIAACDKSPAQIGSGSSPVEVHAGIGGLTPGATYHFRLVTGNANDVNTRVNEPSQGQDIVFGPPTIDSESASNVASTSATLEAQINPQNAGTHARFDYLTEAEYQENGESFSGVHPALLAPEEEADLGSGEADESLLAHVQGLSPDTIYRYRAVARSVLGAPEGAAMTFTTQSSNGALTLIDGREWELVSPPDKHGALIEAVNQAGLANGGLIQASSAGDAITYVADAPTESGAAGYANGVQVLSIRDSGGWGSRDISAPHERATDGSVGFGQEYRFFSSDLSAGILQPFGGFDPALSPDASEQTPYLRSEYSPSYPGQPCMGSCYRPLVIGCPQVGQACSPAVEEHADVPPGTVFGNLEFVGKTFSCPPEPRCGPLFVGATPDASHVALVSSVALTGIPGDVGGLYEWAAGRLTLVSVLPDGKPTGGSLGAGNADAAHAISDDGSRVFFTGEDNHLYVRVNAAQEQSGVQAGRCTEPAKACTLQLDGVQSGAGGGEGVALFRTASSDGSRVFFTDPRPLTAGSSASGADLYQCEIDEEAGNPHCVLTDLTPSAGESAGVQGVLGASEDGSYVYFVADGALTGSESNAHSEIAAGGKANLYVSHGGASSFIASLSSEDAPDWATSLVQLTARVSASGDWLAFMSNRPLTGYDNRDVLSGEPDEEVYLYHAPVNAAQGMTVCASCDPTGARPRGIETEKLNQEKGIVIGESGWSGKTWLAANIPGYTRISVSGALYQSRYLSDSGRLFFNSSDALVSQDVDGGEDVYEYEPPTVGDCAASSPNYRQASGGCLGLISAGTSPKESAFLDASENGADVFFLTVAQLSKQDVDGALDVYDAHACTTESPCAPAPPPPPPACEGDACQSAPLVPDDPTPGSLTFQAPPGNTLAVAVPLVRPKAATHSVREQLTRALKACRKKQKKKRAACERQARRASRAARRASRSHTTRTARSAHERSGR